MPARGKPFPHWMRAVMPAGLSAGAVLGAGRLGDRAGRHASRRAFADGSAVFAYIENVLQF